MPRKKGSRLVGVILFAIGFIFLIIGSVAITMARNQGTENANRLPKVPSAPAEKIDVPADKDAYQGGFIVGQARHNNKESGLSPETLERMASANTMDKPTSSKSSFILGYRHGFAGKAPGGADQKPLPILPIKVDRKPLMKTSKLGVIGSKGKTPLQSLAALVAKNPGSDLFVVTADLKPNKNVTDNVKLVYDRANRHFMKMSRLELNGVEDTYQWTLFVDIGPESLNETDLWGLETNLRKISSKYGEAKSTVPLKYLSNQEIAGWP